MVNLDFLRNLLDKMAYVEPEDSAWRQVDQLKRENQELKARLAVCELQLFNVTTVAQDLLEQKDKEIAKLYAEAVEARELSPFQFGLQMPWAKN